MKLLRPGAKQKWRGRASYARSRSKLSRRIIDRTLSVALLLALLFGTIGPAQGAHVYAAPSGTVEPNRVAQDSEPGQSDENNVFLPFLNQGIRADMNGFGFTVEPSTESVETMVLPAVLPVDSDSSSGDMALSTDSGSPRKLMPLFELGLNKLRVEFLAHKKVVIWASFTNVTSDRYFSQPFTFERSQHSWNVVNSVEPTVTDADLGGDGILAPGETTAMLPFEVEYKRFLFIYVTDAFAVVSTEANSVPVAGDDSFSTDEDQPLSVVEPGVLGNDTDGDSDALTAAVVASVAHGDLNLAADGAFVYTPTVGFHGVDGFTYQAHDGAALSNMATVTITVEEVTPPDPTLPPDPATIAPPIDPTVATDLARELEFIYTGENPIQTGVIDGAIEVTRTALLRGNVLNRDGAPLTGVTITVQTHPEYGFTLSRADGAFDLVVNGGETLVVNYEKEGFLPAQRLVTVAWQDFGFLPDVVLIPLDSQVTPIDLADPSTPIQVARGNPVSDADGARQATLFFAQGTTAEMVMLDGTTQPLTNLNVRATEYTVGERGPEAMPGALPPTSGYTYAAEFSVDEALAAGATEVRFSQPVINYVENFLGFPVGGIVPVGYYDRVQARWIAADNGRVIAITAIEAGMAAADVDGDGVADDATTLAALGITDAERVQLATLYQPGQSLWRVPIDHFTPWDCNWPYGPPDGALDWRKSFRDSGEDDELAERQDNENEKPQDGDCESISSIIECGNQILRERIAIMGTPYSLNYASDRVPGRTDNTIEIPLTPSIVPPVLERVELLLEVAGQKIHHSFDAEPNLRHTFTWDGRDGYGRLVQGTLPVVVRIRYFYGAVYLEPSEVERSFGALAGSLAIFGTNRSENEIFLESVYVDEVSRWDARGQALGGWTIDIQHGYAADAQLLYRGDGTRVSPSKLNGVLNTVAGDGTSGSFAVPGMLATQSPLNAPLDVAFAPDGTLHIVESSAIPQVLPSRVLRITPNGIFEVIAGTRNQGADPTDGHPATETDMTPFSIAFGPDGLLYIADFKNSCIRRVNADGLTQTIAGRCRQAGFAGDGGPAVSALLNRPTHIAIGADGTLYITDSENNRIRRVGTDGTISTYAGDGGRGLAGDGGLAPLSRLNRPEGLTVGPDGSLYIADSQNFRVRRVGPDGIISTFIGCVRPPCQDAGPSDKVGISTPTDVSVLPDGGVLVASRLGRGIWLRSSSGFVTPIARGLFIPGLEIREGEPAMFASLELPRTVAYGPDNTIYIANEGNNRIRSLTLPFPDLVGQGVAAVPSPDDTEVYQFDENGRHLRTLDALSGAVRYAFDYDEEGRLTTITDSDGDVTTIERDANGLPTAIVGPYGQRTTLGVNADGYLDRITDPAGQSYAFTYHPGGLLASLTDPRNNQTTFAYNERGRLTRDTNAVGGFIALDRAELASGYVVTRTTALGRETTFEIETQPNGNVAFTTVTPNGAVSVSSVRNDGTQEVIQADGTVITVQFEPDPRWGMMAQTVPNITTLTPSGLTQTTTTQRTVALAEGGGPLDVESVTIVTTVNDKTFTDVYDVPTRTGTSTTAEGRVATYVLDEQSRILQQQFDATLAPVVYNYDEHGRLAERSQGDLSRTYQYDDLGRLASIIDPAGNAIQYEYDDANRLTRRILPSGAAFSYEYDAVGNLVAVTLPSGRVHQLDYTPINQMADYVAPGAEFPGTVRTYDLDKAVDLVTMPSGRVIDYSYDSGGRVTGLNYPAASVSFDYDDATERLGGTTRTPSSGLAQSVDYGYDGPLVTDMAWSGAANGTFSYGYDNDFNINSMTFDGATVAIAYDDDGNMTAFGPFNMARSGPAGSLSNINDGTLDLNLSYDAIWRLDQRTHAVAGQSVYAINLDYENRGLMSRGRIATKTETVAGVTHVYTYGYDVDGQLREVMRDGEVVEAYAYNADGDRISTLAGTAVYDDRGLLTQLGDVFYTFDADGFLAQRGTDLFEYGARGELIRATLGDGMVITYSYDGVGRRVSRTQSDENGSATVQYLYGDPGNVFLVTHVRDAAGVVTALFYDQAGLLYAMERDGVRFYVATDQVGTPKVVSDGSGAVVKTLDYDSFGRLLDDSNPGFDVPLGYAGGLADRATGLVRFGLRDYDPAAGRWTAHDPVLFDGGQENLYVYVDNDPINLRDPMGLWCVGGSFYSVFGGGGEVCWSDDGFSVCGEVGLGFGTSANVSTEGARRTGTEIIAEAEVAWNGVGAKAGFKLKDCGNFDGIAEGMVGPLKFNGEKLEADYGEDGKYLPKPKVGASAKLVAKACAGF